MTRYLKGIFICTLMGEAIWICFSYLLMEPVLVEQWEQINKVMQAEVLFLGIVFGIMWSYVTRK